MQHQAGSDSLLTGQVYFKMRDKIFGGTIDEERYKGQVWGLNGQMPQSMTAPREIPANGTPYYSSNGGPSTPQTGNIGLAQTPAGNAHQSGYGTPGGFGNFYHHGGKGTG